MTTHDPENLRAPWETIGGPFWLVLDFFFRWNRMKREKIIDKNFLNHSFPKCLCPNLVLFRFRASSVCLFIFDFSRNSGIAVKWLFLAQK